MKAASTKRNRDNQRNDARYETLRHDNTLTCEKLFYSDVKNISADFSNLFIY